MRAKAVLVATALCMVTATFGGASAQSAPGAQTQRGGPIAPGGIRITTRNPMLGNWVCVGQACTCKPLACAAPSRVSYSSSPTPARSPNPQALEKFAKVEVPKRIMAANAAQAVLSDGKNKIEVLGSKVTKHLGYPSVLSEAKSTQGNSVVIITTAMIFAGPVLLTVTSLSTDRGVAMTSLGDFIQAMTIEEGPPLNSNAPPAAPVPPVVPGKA